MNLGSIFLHENLCLIANFSNIYPPLFPYPTENKGMREEVAGVRFLLRELFENMVFLQYYFLNAFF